MARGDGCRVLKEAAGTAVVQQDFGQGDVKHSQHAASSSEERRLSELPSKPAPKLGFPTPKMGGFGLFSSRAAGRALAAAEEERKEAAISAHSTATPHAFTGKLLPGRNGSLERKKN